MMKAKILATMTALTLTAPLAQAQRWGGPSVEPWKITKTSWSEEDERNYSDFVQALGRSQCNTVDDCFRHPANPYRDSDPTDQKFFSDCADFPYVLRAYFAWKNGLPFGYVSGLKNLDTEDPLIVAEAQNSVPPKQLDHRYSVHGNAPTARRSLVPKKDGEGLDFLTEMKTLNNIVSSAMFRMNPRDLGNISSDFYSPEIRPGSIRPGTIIYDANGHVAVIYEVTPEGRLLYFDAHPDNSITHGIFSSKFGRSNPQIGAGLKNFRPVQLVGARQSWWGNSYYGGQLAYAKNEQIVDFSLTQYYGAQPNYDQWRSGTFKIEGRSFDFQEYTRIMLSSTKLNIVTDFENNLKELCQDMKERADAVDKAVAAGMHLKPHPGVLPSNIFQTSGDWETYSTPSRDARLRTTFIELKRQLEQNIKDVRGGTSRFIEYRGDNLKRDLLRAYHKVNSECSVSYVNSQGRKLTISFELAMKRLPRMSFDPYHCVERRWGASHPEELRTCQDDQLKTDWFNAQQRLRNHIERDWSAPAPIQLNDLNRPDSRLGRPSLPDLDIRSFLDRIP